MVAIIDYDAGNIRSVEKAVSLLGEDVKVTRERGEILSADHIILPGVGAFGDAMEKLHSYGLTEVIEESVGEGIPFLGICLGLQLLFESSEESEGVKGLGILPGRIVRLPEVPGLKIPHIGWNSLRYPNEGRLFAGIPEESYVYFVHSYYLQAEEEEIVTATTLKAAGPILFLWTWRESTLPSCLTGENGTTAEPALPGTGHLASV